MSFWKEVKDYNNILYGLIQTLFPSSQSTYSTDPRRNLNAKGNFFPQSCSTRQKKGSASECHSGNNLPMAGDAARRGATNCGRARKCKLRLGLLGLAKRSMSATGSVACAMKIGLSIVFQVVKPAPCAIVLQSGYPKRNSKSRRFIIKRKILVRKG